MVGFREIGLLYFRQVCLGWHYSASPGTFSVFFSNEICEPRGFAQDYRSRSGPSCLCLCPAGKSDRVLLKDGCFWNLRSTLSGNHGPAPGSPVRIRREWPSNPVSFNYVICRNPWTRQCTSEINHCPLNEPVKCSVVCLFICISGSVDSERSRM
jgi:hypothetical protein